MKHNIDDLYEKLDYLTEAVGLGIGISQYNRAYLRTISIYQAKILAKLEDRNENEIALEIQSYFEEMFKKEIAKYRDPQGHGGIHF